MNIAELELMKLIHGERTERIPFWEVWFGMGDLLDRRWAGDEIAAARELGWQALSLRGLGTGGSFQVTNAASDGTDHYSGGGLHSLAQLEEILMPAWEQAIPRLIARKEELHEEGLACWLVLSWCFHAIATGMGLENFALRCYDDPEFVHAAMEWVEQRNRSAIDTVVAQVRPDFVLFDGDCAYKNALMIRPDMFREFTFERTKETVAHLREIAIPYTFHTDGKLDDVIPMLIELGFSAVHGCEKQANDLDELVERFGDSICLVGNMDVVFLAHATVEEVRRETEQMLITGGRKGRFAAACNTSPLDYIPDENYLAFADVIKNF